MNRKLYYVIITILFGVLSIPTILSILFQESFLQEEIDRAFIKTILIFFICFIESYFIKKTIPEIVGWIFSFVLLIGILRRIMHWTWGNEFIVIAGLVVLINLIVMAILERNKSLIHYLLFLFVFQRLSIILLPPNEFLWWVDVILSFVITLLGIVYIFKKVDDKTNGEEYT